MSPKDSISARDADQISTHLGAIEMTFSSGFESEVQKRDIRNIFKVFYVHISDQSL